MTFGYGRLLTLRAMLTGEHRQAKHSRRGAHARATWSDYWVLSARGSVRKRDGWRNRPFVWFLVIGEK